MLLHGGVEKGLILYVQAFAGCPIARHLSLLRAGLASVAQPLLLKRLSLPANLSVATESHSRWREEIS